MGITYSIVCMYPSGGTPWNISQEAQAEFGCRRHRSVGVELRFSDFWVLWVGIRHALPFLDAVALDTRIWLAVGTSFFPFVSSGGP